MQDQNVYFIFDDVIGEDGTEGFHVLFGDPYVPAGTRQFAARTMGECLQWLRPHLTVDEPVYRVRLARRHGAHSVTAISPRTLATAGA